MECKKSRPNSKPKVAPKFLSNPMHSTYTYNVVWLHGIQKKQVKEIILLILATTCILKKGSSNLLDLSTEWNDCIYF